MQGGKINGSHTILIDAAVKVIKAAYKDPNVTKVSLGFITLRLPVGAHRIKFTPIRGGLKVDVRGTNSKQELFVYTSNPASTEHTLFRAFK